MISPIEFYRLNLETFTNLGRNEIQDRESYKKKEKKHEITSRKSFYFLTNSNAVSLLITMLCYCL